MKNYFVLFGRNNLYRPTLENFIGSLLNDVESELKKIKDANSYMIFSRFFIPSLSIATEVLLKEIARVRYSLIKQVNQDSAFDQFINNSREFRNRNEFNTKILDKSISLYSLLQVYKIGTVPNYFDLHSITSDADIHILDEFRKKVRNPLFHEGNMSPNDQSNIENSFKIISNVYEEYYNHSYKIKYYIDQIQRIPEIKPYSQIKKVFLSCKTEIESVLSNLNNDENWKVYCISKFVILLLCNELIINVKSHISNILGLFHLFSNFESHGMQELHLFTIFKEIGFIEIYQGLRNIKEESLVLNNNDIYEDILFWAEINLIKEMMKEKVKERNIPNDKIEKTPGFLQLFPTSVTHIDEERISDDKEFLKILINSTSYNRIRKALFNRESSHDDWRKKWREERNREDKSDSENEIYLTQTIDIFRQKISNKIAIKMFKLSFLFYKKFYERYKDI